MKPTFVFSLDAEFDLSGIVNFIAERNLDAAIDLLDQINDTCQTLAENPDLGELREGYGVPGCRSFTVGWHVIFFKANRNGIDVARIIDGRRPALNDLQCRSTSTYGSSG